MPRSSKKTVGLIGLGIIGSRAASNLRKAGYQVLVWNRSPKPEPNFVSSAAEVVESAKIIQLFVSDGAALLETVESMAPGLTPAHVVLNHATVAPEETRRAGAVVEERHAKFLDAPFTGSRDAAAAGQLVFFVGGESAALDAVRSILEVNARVILPMGGIGDATTIKVATNLIAAVSVSAYAEALALLNRAGVDLAKLPEALEHHAARSGLSDLKVGPMVVDDFEPRFALRHMFKDIQIALDLASDTGLDLPAAGAFAGAAMAGIQHGWSTMDFSVIARLYGYPDTEAQLDTKYLPQSTPPSDQPASAPKKRWPLFGGKSKS